MGLLDDLLESNSRGDADDFVKRYDRGEPYDGISDDEAAEYHRRASRHMSDDDYELSAKEAFARLSPKERKKLGRMMRDRGRKHDLDFRDLDGDGQDDRYEDPDTLAKMASRTHKKEPDLLGSLLGGDSGGKGALAGIAAAAFKSVLK
jgi:hypothetical protein